MENVLKLCGCQSGNPQTSKGLDEQMNEREKNSKAYIKETLMQNQALWAEVSPPLVSFIFRCLCVDLTQRPDPNQLLQDPYFQEHWEKHSKHARWAKKPFLRSSLIPSQPSDCYKQASISPNPLKGSVRAETAPPRQARESLAELYHFWKLSGGTLPSLSEDLLIPSPIHRLPSIVRRSSSPVVNKQDTFLLYDDRIIVVGLQKLRDSLEEFKKLDNTEAPDRDYLANFFLMDFTAEAGGPADLPPRDIREKDIDYQRHRVSLFKRLLLRYPATIREVSLTQGYRIPK